MMVAAAVVVVVVVVDDARSSQLLIEFKFTEQPGRKESYELAHVPQANQRPINN